MRDDIDELTDRQGADLFVISNIRAVGAKNEPVESTNFVAKASASVARYSCSA
jgi:hypothetical protein